MRIYVLLKGDWRNIVDDFIIFDENCLWQGLILVAVIQIVIFISLRIHRYIFFDFSIYYGHHLSLFNLVNDWLII